MGYSCNGIFIALLVVLVSWNTQLRCSRAQKCSDPGIPADGNRSIDGDLQVDTAITFDCDAGLELKGSEVIVCINTSSELVWNDTLPSCDAPSFEPSSESSTSSEIVTTLLASPPPGGSTGTGKLIGGVCGGLVLVLITLVTIMALCCKRQRRKSLNITPPPPVGLPPSGDSKVELTITKDSDDEDGDYLVPNVPLDVDNRPRLPAPTSVKSSGSYVAAVSVKRGESVYQNAPAIILSRSRENVNKAAEEGKAGNEPAYQNAGAVQPCDPLNPAADTAKEREGNVQDDADQIYENSVVASHTGSLAGGRLPRSPAGRKGSAAPTENVSAVSRITPVRKTTPGNFCVLMTPSDDATNDRVMEEEQEVYENAGIMRAGPSPRSRRPPGRSSLTPDPVHTSDYGADYIEIISDR